MAATVQTQGEEMPRPCERCLSSHGPFLSCVVLIMNGTLPLKRTCANCLFNADGNRCSFRDKNEVDQMVDKTRSAQPSAARPSPRSASRDKDKAAESPLIRRGVSPPSFLLSVPLPLVNQV